MKIIKSNILMDITVAETKTALDGGAPLLLNVARFAVKKGIKKAKKFAKENAQSSFENAQENIESSLETAKNFTKSNLVNAKNSAQSSFETAKKITKENAQSSFENAQSSFENAQENIESSLETAKKTAQSSLETAKKSAQSSFETAKENAISGVNTIKTTAVAIKNNLRIGVSNLLQERSSYFQMSAIIILILSNIFTYYSLKYANKNNHKSKTDVAFLYVMVYIYILIYIVIMLFGLKWMGYVSELIFKINGSDTDIYMKMIDDLMKDSFMNIIYILPIYAMIPLLAISLDVNMLFKDTGNYSPYFQLFICLIQLILFIFFKNTPKLEEKDIMKYMIYIITILSVGHQATLDTNSMTNNLEKLIDGIGRIFLNINIQLFLIISPIIITCIMFVAYFFNPEIESVLKISITVSACFVVVLCIFILIEYFKQKISKQSIKVFTNKNAHILYYFKWILNVIIYTSPLLILSIAQKDYSLLNILTEIFNKLFFGIMAIIVIILSILQHVHVLNEDQHGKLVSMLIIVALFVSNHK
jgi:hypothetical protein